MGQQIQWEKIQSSLDQSMDIIAKYSSGERRLLASGSGDELSGLNQELGRLSTKFIGAVVQSVTAADKGKAVCSTIHQYLVQHNLNIDEWNHFSPEDRQAFGEKMQTHADEAFEDADQTHEALRAVRIDIMKVWAFVSAVFVKRKLSKPKMSNSLQDQGNEDPIASEKVVLIGKVKKDLATAQDAVKEASDAINELVTWWREIKSLAMNLKEGPLAKIEPENRLYLVLVLSTWTDLEGKYTEYIHEIEKMMDKHGRPDKELEPTPSVVPSKADTPQATEVAPPSDNSCCCCCIIM